MEMRVVIVGASATGIELAKRLSSLHQVLLLDREIPPLAELGTVHTPESGAAEKAGGPGLLAICGDGSSRLVLQRLYEEDVNCALVAVTGTLLWTPQYSAAVYPTLLEIIRHNVDRARPRFGEYLTDAEARTQALGWP